MFDEDFKRFARLTLEFTASKVNNFDIRASLDASGQFGLFWDRKGINQIIDLCAVCAHVLLQSNSWNSDFDKKWRCSIFVSHFKVEMFG